MIKNMKLIYDNQVFSFQKYGGISRIFVELAKRIMGKEGTFVSIIAVGTNNYYLNTLRGKRIKDNRWTNIYLRMIIFNYINKFFVKLKCSFYPNSILHTTYYDTWYLEHCKSKIVCTIHDMTFEKYPDMFDNSEKIINSKKRYIYESDLIIAISEYTKNDILRYYPDVQKEKIKVIYHGNSMKSIEYIRKKGKKYILFVGNREKYKNFTVVLEALFDLLFKYERDIYLVCSGGGKITESEKRIIDTMNLNDRIEQLTCTDDKLSELYINAECLVFPSYNEGFGIPILEAWSCSCPVIAANSSCFPEIAGDAAIYFEPSNHNELVREILEILNNADKKKELIERGKERLKLYDWDVSANMLYEAYCELL